MKIPTNEAVDALKKKSKFKVIFGVLKKIHKRSFKKPKSTFLSQLLFEKRITASGSLFGLKKFYNLSSVVPWKNLCLELCWSFKKIDLYNTLLSSFRCQFGLKNRCFKLCWFLEKVLVWSSVSPFNKSMFGVLLKIHVSAFILEIIGDLKKFANGTVWSFEKIRK